LPKKTREEKEQIIEELREKVSRQTAAVLTQMSGLTVEEATLLRRQIREAGGEFKVTKNTLLRIATEGTHLESLVKGITGPTAVVFSYGDPAVVAKAIKTFTRKVPKLSPLSALLGEKVITSEEVAKLADLPGREELISMMVRTVAAPLTGFMTTLTGVPRKLVYALSAIEGQKNNN